MKTPAATPGSSFMMAVVSSTVAANTPMPQTSERHRQVVCLGVVLPGLVVVAIATRYEGYRYPIEVITGTRCGCITVSR